MSKLDEKLERIMKGAQGKTEAKIAEIEKLQKELDKLQEEQRFIARQVEKCKMLDAMQDLPIVVDGYRDRNYNYYETYELYKDLNAVREDQDEDLVGFMADVLPRFWYKPIDEDLLITQLNKVGVYSWVDFVNNVQNIKCLPVKLEDLLIFSKAVAEEEATGRFNISDELVLKVACARLTMNLGINPMLELTAEEMKSYGLNINNANPAIATTKRVSLENFVKLFSCVFSDEEEWLNRVPFEFGADYTLSVHDGDFPDGYDAAIGESWSDIIEEEYNKQLQAGDRKVKVIDKYSQDRINYAKDMELKEFCKKNDIDVYDKNFQAVYPDDLVKFGISERGAKILAKVAKIKTSYDLIKFVHNSEFGLQGVAMLQDMPADEAEAIIKVVKSKLLTEQKTKNADESLEKFLTFLIMEEPKEYKGDDFMRKAFYDFEKDDYEKNKYKYYNDAMEALKASGITTKRKLIQFIKRYGVEELEDIVGSAGAIVEELRKQGYKLDEQETILNV